MIPKDLLTLLGKDMTVLLMYKKKWSSLRNFRKETSMMGLCKKYTALAMNLDLLYM